MGWETPWYTLTDDFDADFGVDEWHGTNVFYRDDDDRVFRTYFVDKRGDEALGSTWAYLDITALGRQELWEDSPEGYPQTEPYGWWNLHDEYDDATVFEEALSEATNSQRGARTQALVIAHVVGVPEVDLRVGGAVRVVLVVEVPPRCASPTAACGTRRPCAPTRAGGGRSSTTSGGSWRARTR